MRVPSGLSAMLLLCPDHRFLSLSAHTPKVSFTFPVSASHTRTVLSWLRDARRLPSRLYDTLMTSAVCPQRVYLSWSVSRSHAVTMLPAPTMIRPPPGLNAIQLAMLPG